MIIRIACADTNTEYLERLIEVLEDSAELHLSMYSDAAILRENAQLGRFDVLLLDPSMYSRDLPIERIPVTIMLAGENRIPYECDTLPAIRKYQRITGIRQSILEICSKHPKFGGGNDGTGGSAAVVAFYSPIGGAGKTTAALVAAARLAAHGKRALYVNLEHFASDGFYLPANAGEAGLSAVMEQLGEKGADLFMKSCIRTKADNFFYIKHFDSPNDWVVMSGEECAALLLLLRQSGSFDVICVDLDAAYNDKTTAAFNAADKIVLVDRADKIGTQKMEAFLAQTHIMDEYSLKMSRLSNFAAPNTPAPEGPIPSVGRLTTTSTADAAALVSHKVSSPEAGFALTLA